MFQMRIFNASAQLRIMDESIYFAVIICLS